MLVSSASTNRLTWQKRQSKANVFDILIGWQRGVNEQGISSCTLLYLTDISEIKLFRRCIFTHNSIRRIPYTCAQNFPLCDLKYSPLDSWDQWLNSLFSELHNWTGYGTHKFFCVSLLFKSIVFTVSSSLVLEIEMSATPPGFQCRFL